MAERTHRNNMEEEIFAQGRLFELVHIEQPDGRVFEVARRAPGVRVIIADEQNQKVLLTREFRRELNGWDYRLPGGKVYDTLEEFESARASNDDILEAVRHKSIAEASEEAGVSVEDVELYSKSTLGATVEWDLYVMVATAWQVDEAGQSLEAGEDIEAVDWVDYDRAKQMVMDGDINEDRIALILLRWLEGQK